MVGVILVFVNGDLAGERAEIDQLVGIFIGKLVQTAGHIGEIAVVKEDVGVFGDMGQDASGVTQNAFVRVIAIDQNEVEFSFGGFDRFG